MRRHIVAVFAVCGMFIFSSCSKRETAEAPPPKTEAQPAATSMPAASTAPAPGPHVFVHLKSGPDVPGSIVASSQTDMVIAGDDGIERKIPLTQIKSVEYKDAAPAQAPAATAKPVTKAETKPAESAPAQTTPATASTPSSTTPAAERQPAPAVLTPAPVTTKTYELAAGSEVSVRTNETIDSGAAAEGQTFDAQVTRNALDANGDVVIPRGSRARIVIKSASKGGRVRGASDLVLDLQSITINGKPYRVDTADISKKGTSGIGANKRTAAYTGGAAAFGAIIGAIAGGGKGAAIGAGAGAGAGALTQVLTKGRSIKVPVESVLTFRLDRPLRVTAE